MDFFISASDNPYNHWQLSLLIESFKKLGLEDHLVVCLTDRYKNPLILEKKFLKNLINHKRLYKLPDFTSQKKYRYKSLNKIHSLLFALKEGFIKQPLLMFFKPDLVIKEKVMLPEGEFIDFLFSIDPKFNFETTEKNYPNFWNILNSNRENFKQNWLEIGNIIAFNNFPEEFFKNFIMMTENLVEAQKDKVWEDTLKLSLVLMLLNGNPKVRLTKVLNFESNALSLQKSNFITYKDGILPNFHKSMFKYDPISLGNPIEILSNIYNCPNTKYISELANKILDPE